MEVLSLISEWDIISLLFTAHKLFVCHFEVCVVPWYLRVYHNLYFSDEIPYYFVFSHSESTAHYIVAGDRLNTETRWDGYDLSFCTLRSETQAASSAPPNSWNNGYNIATSCCKQDGSDGARPDCNASGVTYDEAKAVCENYGYRLCTFQELWIRITDGKGCGFDSAYNWVSDECYCWVQVHFLAFYTVFKNPLQFSYFTWFLW